MAYSNTEFTDAAREKFCFLVDEYGFEFSIKDARGIYLSQVVFVSAHLRIEIGVWGQGNELWIIFTSLVSKKAPPFDILEVLNGLTDDSNYFEENVSKKTTWPISDHSFPQYFEVCAFEIRKHCGKILEGDLHEWIDIAKNIVNHRAERALSLSQRNPTLELSETARKDLDPLVEYVKSIDPSFSLTKVQYNILDKLTR